MPLSQFNAKAGRSDGHRSECKTCQSLFQKKYATENRTFLREKNKKYRSENPEKAKKFSKTASRKRRENGSTQKYEMDNRERLAEMRAEWWRKNPDKRKEYNKKYYSDAKGKISSAIRTAIRSEIRFGSKGGRRTFDLLGYTPDDLRSHLEKLFQPGMTWENYGRGGWHIDHRIPLSAHNYETPDCPDFKRAWALTNLQPLWERDNLSKGAKLDVPFQPTLAIGC